MRNLSENAKKINDEIKGLVYDPLQVMAFQGETITKFIPKTGLMDNDRFVVVTKTKHEVNGKYDIAVPNARKDITYPGALLIGNQKLVEGVPDPLVVRRRPMEITIDLPGLTENNHVEVENPNYTGVTKGMNILLNNWLKNKANQFSISANMSYKKSILYDEKSMALTFGCDVEYLQNRLGIDFQAITKQESSAYLIQFKQIYYTVSAQLPEFPADVFADDVTWDDIRMKIDANNPPCYVQNVQYGREVYLLLQSSMSSSDLKAHVEGNLTLSNTKISSNQSAEMQQMNKNINCTIITLGGKPVVVNGNLQHDHIIEKVNELIQENVVLSADNPAFPLSYTVAFLKDNKIASIQGKSEYITSEATIFKSGKLNLYHGGAYVARFYITWEEIEYDDLGNIVVTKKQWDRNGHQVTAGFSTMINFKANVRNIHVVAQGATGLVWEPWRTSLDSVYPLIQERSIGIYGTTLNQTVQVNPSK